MAGDERDADARQPDRNKDEQRENDHRPAQGPDHLEQRHAVVEVELQSEAADDDDLENNEPEPACVEKCGELAAGLSGPRERGARPGEKKERWRADVRDPSSEEQGRRRSSEIRGIAGDAEKVARVIERHENHRDAANDVDRLDSQFARAIRPTGLDRDRRTELRDGRFGGCPHRYTIRRWPPLEEGRPMTLTRV